MRAGELLVFSVRGLSGHGLRSGLSLLGVAVGVAAVVVLTALGEGARRYVVDQFTSLGTNLLVVLPGKTDTTGVPGPGGVPNDLTLEDARAIARQVRGARRVAPLAVGTEEVAYGDRRRRLAVIGTTAEYRVVRQLVLERGQFLPEEEWTRGTAVAVLGHTAARELFPGDSPLGAIIRVGGWRMRVVGVLAPQGVKLGVNFDEVAMVPVATAMRMFNRSSLFRLLVQVPTRSDLEATKQRVIELIVERHQEEDVTVVTQDAVVSTFSAVLDALTVALAAIAAISLSVAGIGIMNVMLVSVSERTREIGLLRALGAGRRQILAIFLAEAILLSAAGGVTGVAFGGLVVAALVRAVPALPASPPAWAVAAALATSLGVGVVFGLLPARQATRLDPVAALQGRGG